MVNRPTGREETDSVKKRQTQYEPNKAKDKQEGIFGISAVTEAFTPRLTSAPRIIPTTRSEK
jgi:hypothetical protein